MNSRDVTDTHACRVICWFRLVFSQSLISLDLIEDFLELAGRAKEEGKPSPYKGELFSHVVRVLLHAILYTVNSHTLINLTSSVHTQPIRMCFFFHNVCTILASI